MSEKSEESENEEAEPSKDEENENEEEKQPDIELTEDDNALHGDSLTEIQNNMLRTA